MTILADIATMIAHSDRSIDGLHLVDGSGGWRITNALWRWFDGHGPRA